MESPEYHEPKNLGEYLDEDTRALLIATDMWSNGNEDMANEFYDAYHYGMPWTRRVIERYKEIQDRKEI